MFKQITLFLNLPKILEDFEMQLSELAQTITQIGVQLTKAQDEILAKIEDLEEALTDVVVSPEVENALESLKGVAQALDDIVPD